MHKNAGQPELENVPSKSLGKWERSTSAVTDNHVDKESKDVPPQVALLKKKLCKNRMIMI